MSALDIDEALQRLLDRGRDRAIATGQDHAELWRAMSNAASGGKRFRPALVLAAHDLLGGTCRAAALETGAAVELLHTALVIHDDVIDGDDVRRGRPNVSGTFRASALAAGASQEEAQNLALSAGILAGDLALAAAIRAVATCGAPVDVTHRVLDLFDAALHTTAAGELADVRLSLGAGTATLPESLTMEEQKTSAYSFALPLQAGAVLAGADHRIVEALGEAGRLLGVAFQLVDDLLGVFGDPSTTGKSATSDLRAGKQTPLLAHARSTTHWEQIAPYVGRDLEEAELHEVRRLLGESGSQRYVEDLADQHHSAARTVIEDLGLPPDLLAALTGRFTSRAGSDVAA